MNCNQQKICGLNRTLNRGHCECVSHLQCIIRTGFNTNTTTSAIFRSNLNAVVHALGTAVALTFVFQVQKSEEWKAENPKPKKNGGKSWGDCMGVGFPCPAFSKWNAWGKILETPTWDKQTGAAAGWKSPLALREMKLSGAACASWSVSTKGLMAAWTALYMWKIKNSKEIFSWIFWWNFNMCIKHFDQGRIHWNKWHWILNITTLFESEGWEWKNHKDTYEMHLMNKLLKICVCLAKELSNKKGRKLA